MLANNTSYFFNDSLTIVPSTKMMSSHWFNPAFSIEFSIDQGSMSNPFTSRAPSFVATKARIPVPVPASKTDFP